MSLVWPAEQKRTPMQERHRQLASFRQALEKRVVEDLGPNHIWVMHFAGDLEAVDAVVCEKVFLEAQKSKGCAVRLSAQHSQSAVDHALARWGCKVASSAAFEPTSPDTGETIHVSFLVRPAA